MHPSARRRGIASMLTVCGSAQKTTSARFASSSVERFSHLRLSLPCKLGWIAEMSGSSVCRVVSAVILTFGCRSSILMSSRAV